MSDTLSSLFLALMGTMVPAVVVVALVLSLIISASRTQRVSHARAAAARELGLMVQKEGLLTPDCAVGDHEGLPVEVRSVKVGKAQAERITVTVPTLGRDLSLSGEGLMSAVGKLLVGEDIAVGDPVFDAEIVVRGAPARALAALDAATRQRVLQVVKRSGFVLRDGSLRRESTRVTVDPSVLLMLLREALTLARTLDALPPEQIPQRLAWNAEHDPLESVRRRNLLILCDTLPGHEISREACIRAMADPSPWVRIEGARALGSEGIECLRRLLSDQTCPATVAVQALSQLFRVAHPDQIGREIEGALQGTRPAIQLEAARAAGKIRHAPAVATLTELARGEDVALARAAVTALGLIGDPASETVLLDALGHQDPRVREEAVRGLANLGTIAAIPYLSSLKTDSDAPRSLREVAALTIRAIQSRLVGAGAGQLSLGEAQEPAGALSLAETPADESGGVSLATHEETEEGSASRS